MTGTTMRAAVYYGVRDIRIETRPVPVPSAGELLVQVSAVGVCGTDATEWAHGPRLYAVDHRNRVTGHLGPLVPGHEFSGHVVGVGHGVDPDLVGRLVASGGVWTCGECRTCVSGSGPCARYNVVGLHRDGALAEFVTVPTTSCVAAPPDGMTSDEAALCQPTAIAHHATRRAHVRRGERAIVVGVGGVGAFLVSSLVGQGVEVSAVDIQPRRQETARKLGAHRAAAAIEQLDLDVDVIFEVTGRADVLEQVVAAVRPGTRMVLVGIQKTPSTLDLAALTLAENDLITSNGLTPSIDLPAAVETVRRLHGRWADVAPPPLPLHELVPGALEPLSRGADGPIKTLIDPRL